MVAACARTGPSSSSPTAVPEPVVVSKPIHELFKTHGIECRQNGDWVEFPNQSIRASGVIIEKLTPEADQHSVQLDFRMELDSGQTLIESFAGIGKSRQEAIDDAVLSFAQNSFSAISAAFFGAQNNQVQFQNWTIAGQQRRIVIGPIGMGGTPPDPSNTSVDWFKQVRNKIESTNLAAGIHWIRIDYRQIDNHLSELEVLLDNDVWEETEKELAAVDWPKGKPFFGLRLFMIVQDK